MDDGRVVGEEEIPLSGWNWMVSLEGGIGGAPDVEGAVRPETAGSLSSQ